MTMFFHSAIRILAFLLAPLFLFPAPARSELVDRVIAVVNEEVITLSDLNQEGAPLFRRITQQVPPGQLDQALLKAREEILSSLIDKLIVQQRAEKLGISVSEEEVDKALQEMLEQRHLSLEAFRRDLALLGMTEDSYRDQVRHQILQSKLVGYEIRSKVVITDQMIEEYYQEHYLNKRQQGAYHILQMGFTWDPKVPETRREARKRAEKARGRVLAGEDFRMVARELSELASAEDGGDIGVFQKEEMASYMREAVLPLNAGEVSPIIETPAGFQFFMLLSRQGNARAQRPLEEVRDEIRDILYKQAMDSQYQKWVQQLRDEAYIKKML